MITRISLFFLFLFFALPGKSNVAEPGILSSGGTGNYTLLFPGDSSYYQKIQMQEELVIIQLYRGFAVVKGTYWMLNTTSDTIVMNAGYPVNSRFNPHVIQSNGTLNVDFDDLYSLKVSTNGISRAYSRNEIELSYDQFYSEKQYWYTWIDTFPPNRTSQIEIYFIVNTNNSEMRCSYTEENDNVFVYLLESGASWKPPIGKGDFYVQLMDDLEADEIRGISPDSIFYIDERKQNLYYHFENLIPDEGKNNIVIAYGEKIPHFNFGDIIKESESYFKKIDEFNKADFSQKQIFNPGDPYSFDHLWDDPMLQMFFVVIGIALVIIFIVFVIIKPF